MGICFFIDFENVHNSGLSNLKGLSKDDLIFIFYTASTETITLDNINQLNKSRRDGMFIVQTQYQATHRDKLGYGRA